MSDDARDECVCEGGDSCHGESRGGVKSLGKKKLSEKKSLAKTKKEDNKGKSPVIYFRFGCTPVILFCF
jgi:hypothetical protein